LELKKQEQAQKDKDKQVQLRTYLQSVAPHLRPSQQQAGPRAYEATIQDEEKKKAQAVEAQKQQPFSQPTSKQARGMLGKKKQPTSNAFEQSKNIKSG
jgi:hypothetical protein